MCPIRRIRRSLSSLLRRRARRRLRPPGRAAARRLSARRRRRPGGEARLAPRRVRVPRPDGRLAGGRGARARDGHPASSAITRKAPRVRPASPSSRIDPVPFEAALARAEADVVAAEAQHAQASRNASALQAALGSEGRLAEGIRRRRLGRGSRRRAQLKAAKARLTEAQLNLGYTRVESPIPGITSRAMKSEGSLVSGPDVLLTTVTQTDPMYVNFGLSEAEQSRLARDAAAGKLQLPKDGRFEVVDALRGRHHLRQARPARLLGRARLRQHRHVGCARGGAQPRGRACAPASSCASSCKGAVRPEAIAVPQRAVMEGPQGKMVYVLGRRGRRPSRVPSSSASGAAATGSSRRGPQARRQGHRRRAHEGVPGRPGAGGRSRTQRPARRRRPGEGGAKRSRRRREAGRTKK